MKKLLKSLQVYMQLFLIRVSDKFFGTRFGRCCLNYFAVMRLDGSTGIQWQNLMFFVAALVLGFIVGRL